MLSFERPGCGVPCTGYIFGTLSYMDLILLPDSQLRTHKGMHLHLGSGSGALDCCITCSQAESMVALDSVLNILIYVAVQMPIRSMQRGFTGGPCSYAIQFSKRRLLTGRRAICSSKVQFTAEKVNRSQEVRDLERRSTLAA